jgi:hypothetical protein
MKIFTLKNLCQKKEDFYSRTDRRMDAINIKKQAKIGKIIQHHWDIRKVYI